MLSGVVVDDAVFHDHQGQPSVDNGLQRDGLGQVPDLGQFQLKGGGGRRNTQALELLEGLAVVDADAKVAGHGEAQIQRPLHPVQSTSQSLGNPQVLEYLQLLLQLVLFPVPADAGQQNSYLYAGFLAGADGVRASGSFVAGQVDAGGLQSQQGRGDLLGAAHRQGDLRRPLGIFIAHAGVEFPLLPLGRQTTLAAELLQGLAAQSVEGGQGQAESLIHIGGDLLALVGSAAGALELSLHLLGGEGDVDGRLRDGSLHPGHVAQQVLGGYLGRFAGADHGVHADELLAVLSAFIGSAGLGVQLPGRLALLAHAEHIGALLVQIVPLGKALAGEGGLQLLQLLGSGRAALPDGPGIDAGDDGHVLRTLHAPLDFQAAYPHLLQLLEIVGQRHVLEGQGILVGPVAPAVFEAAGLGAQTAVAAAAADDGGQVALSRIAHAQGAVGKGLDLNGRVLADVADLIPAQFPGEDRPGKAQFGALLHAVQAVHGHLSGGVQGELRSHLVEHPGHAQILDNDGVHPHLVDLPGHLGGGGQLPVGEQGV